MDDFKHLCPVCKNKGVTNFLQLRQIDLNNAVYLCKDIRCIYPQGHSWIYVEKKLSSDNEDSDCASDVDDDIEAMGILMSQKTAQKKQKPTLNVNTDNLVPNLNLEDIKEVTNQTNNEMFEKSWNQDAKNMLNIEIVNPAVIVENTEQIIKVNKQSSNEIIENSWNQDLKNMSSLEIIHPIITVENTEPVSETTGYKIKINENIENKSKNNENKIKNNELCTTPIAEPYAPVFNPNNPTDFHALFNTRLRLKTKYKKSNDSFKIPDEILQQALQNIQTEKEEQKPKKKKNIVEVIMGKKRNLPNLTNSAASFEGFKFSSKTIKPPNPVVENKIRSKSQKIPTILSRSSKNRTKNSVVNLNEGKVLDISANCSNYKLEAEENIIKDDTTLSLLNDLIDTMDDGTDKNTSYKLDDPEFESWLESYIIT